MLTIISKHPLRDSYMLYCPATAIPPYFGSLRECEKAQVTFERKLQSEFDKLPDSEQSEIINMIDSYRMRDEVR